MKFYFHFLVILCFLTFSLTGQILAQADALVSPESVGMSAQHLDYLDQFIQENVANQIIPGGTFAISRKGKIVYHKSFGTQQVGGDQAYANDDIYRLASMTKAVTCVAIMQLMERGLISLNDPISRYIPAFKTSQIATFRSTQDSSYSLAPAKKQITIRHLLSHTSGLAYGPFNPGPINAMYQEYQVDRFGLSDEYLTTAEMVDRLASVPLLFEPGTEWKYGLNMEVLGRIVELVSGQALDDYFRQHIFDPLGMDDTFFYLPAELHERLVPVYSYSEAGELINLDNQGYLGNIDYPKVSGLNHFAGGGGLSGTSSDYMIFCSMLLNDGRLGDTRILGRKSVELMLADQLVVLNKFGKGMSPIPGHSFALGFEILGESAAGLSIKSAGTYEWGGFFNTKFFIDPDESLAFVGMTQIVPFPQKEFWDKLYQVIYAAIDD